jgi:isocitrate dehydrogenase kinase/phosphatase
MTLTDSRLANVCAEKIAEAFKAYQTEFCAITRRASTRFAQRDWHGLHNDASARLELYGRRVQATVAQVRELLDARVQDKLVWASSKAVYSGLIAKRDDWEIAETFFNSITRRIFTTVGVDPQIEFVDSDFDAPPTLAAQAIYRTYPGGDTPAALIARVLVDFALDVPYRNLARTAIIAARAIEQHLQAMGAPRQIDRAEMARPVFYRGNGAYLIGKLVCGAYVVPLVLAFLNDDASAVLDAVLLTEDEVSILFSFAHSYFHVDVARPYDLVHFLRTLMPRKRIAELYISLGYHKHGKTELYRDLLHHLAHTQDRFEIAPGEHGMVMTVFTMPSYDVVLKIIKDEFQEPKTSTREQVRAKYNLVFTHDRAGRLIDAQEFEWLEFDRCLFANELLNELRRVAASSVNIGDECVVIRQVYIERRLTPLNIFLRTAESDAVRAAVMDYGNALRDLAAANIFPGDLLLKNFGVTRHGRVVLYDYDEVCLLTECHFREMPAPRNDDETLAGEPWFAVGANDVFPEEFATWLGLPSPWREVFAAHHGELFTAAYWQALQARIRRGEVIHIFPYPASKRLGQMSV